MLVLMSVLPSAAFNGAARPAVLTTTRAPAPAMGW